MKLVMFSKGDVAFLRQLSLTEEARETALDVFGPGKMENGERRAAATVLNVGLQAKFNGEEAICDHGGFPTPFSDMELDVARTFLKHPALAGVGAEILNNREAGRVSLNAVVEKLDSAVDLKDLRVTLSVEPAEPAEPVEA